VTLLTRGSSVGLLQSNGIEVTGTTGTHTISPDKIAVEDAGRPSASSLNCDILIVATKAYQVSEVLSANALHARPGAGPKNILLLQNGWGSADEAAAALPAGVGIFSSIMMIGIERRSPIHVNINALAGPVRIGTLFGSDSNAVDSLIAIAGQSFLPMVYAEQIEPAILNKFLFNTCMNASGALTGLTYGELITKPHSRSLITHIANETLHVLDAARGYREAESGAHYVDSMLAPFVMANGAAHRSSMLQDVEAGRRTEIDYLNGAVVRMGRSAGIETPFNEAIVSLLHARERFDS
jgi:2-dehydropantoate 2-reductase